MCLPRGKGDRSSLPRSRRTPDRVSGLSKPGDLPPRGGLYLLDVVPDGDVRFGFPNISDNSEAVGLIACGAQVVLFSVNGHTGNVTPQSWGCNGSPHFSYLSQTSGIGEETT